MYISEIEKANDYLKSLVSQSYDSLHTSERYKQEFIAKVNHIENRQYFHRKRKALNIGSNEPTTSGRERRGRSRSPMERLDPGRLRGLSGVRLPHNVYKNLLKEKSQPAQSISLFNRVSVSPEQTKADETESILKASISEAATAKNDSVQKESLEETKIADKSEVKTGAKSVAQEETPRLKNDFYDNISFESQDRRQYKQ